MEILKFQGLIKVKIWHCRQFYCPRRHVHFVYSQFRWYNHCLYWASPFLKSKNSITNVAKKEICTDTNKEVKVLNQKCVLCLKHPSVYAINRNGHQCLCGSSYASFRSLWNPLFVEPKRRSQNKEGWFSVIQAYSIDEFLEKMGKESFDDRINEKHFLLKYINCSTVSLPYMTKEMHKDIYRFRRGAEKNALMIVWDLCDVCDRKILLEAIKHPTDLGLFSRKSREEREATKEAVELYTKKESMYWKQHVLFTWFHYEQTQKRNLSNGFVFHFVFFPDSFRFLLLTEVSFSEKEPFSASPFQDLFKDI